MARDSGRQRARWLLPCLCLLAITACGGGGDRGDSAPGSQRVLAPVQTITIPHAGAMNGITGVEDLVALVYTSTDSGFRESLKIFRQNPANADSLIDVGNVYLGVDTLYHGVSDVSATADWIAVAINRTVYPLQGWVALVSLADNTYLLDGFIEVDSNTIDHVVAKGTWLLVSHNSIVDLYDISTITTPIKFATFAPNGIVKSMTALPAGFFLTTSNGFGYLDVSVMDNVTFVEGTNIDIKDVEQGYYSDGKLYIGGPSKYVGKSKMARLDVTTPASPQMELLNDQIEGNFLNMSVDGSGRYFLLTDTSVSSYVQMNDSFAMEDIAFGVVAPHPENQFYAWNGRFYICVNMDTHLDAYNFDIWVYI